ncbi:hypothetical protein QJQ45_019615 [Haematococcus lacustris]|nr:hypothetical protein QJQ45_019615 [Haematococcus lacustris]
MQSVVGRRVPVAGSLLASPGKLGLHVGPGRFTQQPTIRCAATMEDVKSLLGKPATKSTGFACLEAKAPLQLHTMELPAELPPTEIDIQARTASVTHNGVCHSDLHMRDDDWGLSKFPFFAGLIVNGNNGGFQSVLRAPADFSYTLPDELASEHAAPLLCAGVTVYAPLKRYITRPAMKVAILGVGGLGHLGVQYAAALGSVVTAIDNDLSKKEEAKTLGADEFMHWNDENLASHTGAFDVILNCVSANLDTGKLLSMLRNDGTLVQLGIPGGATMTLPLQPAASLSPDDPILIDQEPAPSSIRRGHKSAIRKPNSSLFAKASGGGGAVTCEAELAQHAKSKAHSEAIGMAQRAGGGASSIKAAAKAATTTVVQGTYRRMVLAALFMVLWGHSAMSFAAHLQFATHSGAPAMPHDFSATRYFNAALYSISQTLLTQQLAADVVFGQKKVAGSIVGGRADMHEMLDFSAAKGIKPMIELMPMHKVNEALARMHSGKAKYRVVLTMDN